MVRVCKRTKNIDRYQPLALASTSCPNFQPLPCLVHFSGLPKSGTAKAEDPVKPWFPNGKRKIMSILEKTADSLFQR